MRKIPVNDSLSPGIDHASMIARLLETGAVFKGQKIEVRTWNSVRTRIVFGDSDIESTTAFVGACSPERNIRQTCIHSLRSSK